MILCLETATKNCSVALYQPRTTGGYALAAAKEAHGEKFIHGEQLHLFIDEVLTKAGCTMSDLTAVVVGKGPGSFTGLRIGISAAKGLAYALDLPLYSVPTLGSFALDRVRQEAALCVLDARRDEVYYQWWTKLSSGAWTPSGEPNYEVVHPGSWKEFEIARQHVAVLGDSVEKVERLLSASQPHWKFYPSDLPSALAFSHLLEKALKGAPEDVAYFEPFYLKDFVAEKSKKKLL